MILSFYIGVHESIQRALRRVGRDGRVGRDQEGIVR
jgi:hypothetical protein